MDVSATVCVATILETATIQAELEAEQGVSTRAKTPFAIGSATRAGREWALCPDTGEAYTYAVDDVSRQLARGVAWTTDSRQRASVPVMRTQSRGPGDHDAGAAAGTKAIVRARSFASQSSSVGGVAIPIACSL